MAQERQPGDSSNDTISELHKRLQGLLGEVGGHISTISNATASLRKDLQEAARQERKIPASDLVACAEGIQGTLSGFPCIGPVTGCTCSLMPVLAHLLEQQQDEVQEVSAVLASGLHKVLPAVAAALLKQGHSTRAFRRVTEAYEMWVAGRGCLIA
jgi:hypothetical protein